MCDQKMVDMQPDGPLQKILRVMSLRVYISGHFLTKTQQIRQFVPHFGTPCCPIGLAPRDSHSVVCGRFGYRPLSFFGVWAWGFLCV